MNFSRVQFVQLLNVCNKKYLPSECLPHTTRAVGDAWNVLFTKLVESCLVFAEIG